jgi:predicted lipid-binding transport protein (Tim44 family)
MNKFLIAILAFGLVVFDASAAQPQRLGGGKNVGAQRSATAQPPAKAPAQQAAPAAAPVAAAPATPPSGMSRWLGPLAGLAIGAGLASMFMGGGGMGSAIGSILMVLLLAGGALFTWKMFRSKPANNLQYAGEELQTPITGTGGTPLISSAVVPEASRFPAGFDAAQFVVHAKTNFTRLQQANDKRDVSTMRDYMTPEFYSAIVAQINPMGVVQHTEIISLEADVVEVVTENDKNIASVQFTGSMRNAATAEMETFDEIWHLEKPLNGASGWLIGGIQQT